MTSWTTDVIMSLKILAGANNNIKSVLLSVGPIYEWKDPCRVTKLYLTWSVTLVQGIPSGFRLFAAGGKGCLIAIYIGSFCLSDCI